MGETAVFKGISTAQTADDKDNTDEKSLASVESTGATSLFKRFSLADPEDGPEKQANPEDVVLGESNDPVIVKKESRESLASGSSLQSAASASSDTPSENDSGKNSLTGNDKAKAAVQEEKVNKNPKKGFFSGILAGHKGKKDSEEQKVPFKLPKPDFLNIVFLGLNVILTALSLAVFAVGLLAIADAKRLNALTAWDPSGRLQNVDLGEAIKDASAGMTVGGLIGVCLGLLGCCGCIRGHKLTLKVYAALVGIAVAIQVIFILRVVVNKESIKTDVKERMLQNLHEGYEGKENSSKLFSQFLDVVQVYFGCCGVTGWTDFEKSPWYKEANRVQLAAGANCSLNATAPRNVTASKNVTLSNNVTDSNCTGNVTLTRFPITCCKSSRNELSAIVGEEKIALLNSDCQKRPAGVDNPNTQIPCFSTIYAWLVSKAFMIIGLLITVLSLEISAASNAVSIASAIKKEEEKEQKDKEKEGEKLKKKGKREKGNKKKKNDTKNESDESVPENGDKGGAKLMRKDSAV